MSITYFIWDDECDTILGEANETGQLATQYTALPVRYGENVSQFNGSAHFPCFDAEGSARQLTDPTANVTDTVSYTAAGIQFGRTGATPLPFAYIGGFGYYTDAETETISVRRRTYSPRLARWLSIDPINWLGQTNLYTAQFMTQGSDPSGEEPIVVDIGGILIFTIGITLTEEEFNCEEGGSAFFELEYEADIFVASVRVAGNIRISDRPNGLPREDCNLQLGDPIFQPYADWDVSDTEIWVAVGAKVGFENWYGDIQFRYALTNEWDWARPWTVVDWEVDQSVGHEFTGKIDRWSRKCDCCFTRELVTDRHTVQWAIRPARAVLGVLALELAFVRLPVFARRMARAIEQIVDDLLIHEPVGI